ncbi:MAG TPA: extracellular solute-binding protein [Ilumatobacter sp.]|nr:extracellular solute-binding protein [Ilumatobacter sp.]
MVRGRWRVLVVGAALAACSAEATGPVVPSPQPPSTTSSPSTPPTGDQVRAAAPSDGSTRAAPGAPAATTAAHPTVPDQPPRCATEPDTGPRTLTVWHRFGADVAPDYLRDELAAFQAAHPDIAIELVRPAGRPEELIAAIADLPPSERPDIVMGASGSVRLQYDSGLFVDPQECTGGVLPASLTDLFPGALHHYTVAGVVRAAPYNVSVPLLMFDRTRWQAAGLDPDRPPATLDEMYATIDTLVESGAATTGMALYDRSANWLVSIAAAREGRLVLEPANGHDGPSIQSIEFEHPGVVEMLTKLHELKAAGRLLWLRENRDGTADLLALIDPTSPSGMTLHTSAALGDVYRLLDTAGLDHIEVGGAPMPGDTITGGQLGGGAWWLVDRDDPAQTAAAWHLVDWLMRPEGVGGLAAATGYVPTSPAAAATEVVQAAWAAHPELRVAYDVARSVRADDASSWQVGFEAEIQRQLELAVAYPIDAGSDPVTELRKYEQAALDWAREYEAALTTP